MQPETTPENAIMMRLISPKQKTGRPYRSSAVLDGLVMTWLTESNQPLSAYDLVRRSSEKGSRVTPAQIYRVLDRLEADSKIQRVELLSAWLPKRDGQQGFMVCRECRAVQAFQIGAVQATVQRLCRAIGFSASRGVFESWGLCAECDSERATAERPRVTGGGQRMPIRLKGLVAMITAAGAMMAIAPADAGERRPGVLYDSAGKELGAITIIDAPKGVLLRIEARGLPPGWHGVHFHEKADCGAVDFKGAGGHVHSVKPIVHGFLKEGANDAGDLPNIHAHADGSVMVELYSMFVSVDGRDGRPSLRDTDGSALVIHVNPDDYTTQPIGGAGNRIACAVVP